jgi:hypothetical protein
MVRLFKIASERLGRLMAEVGIFDRVRVRSTALTDSLGLAGRVGLVYGQTTPSITGVQGIGDEGNDHGFCIRFEDGDQEVWLASDLVEFVDHAPGSTARIGQRSHIRDEKGVWHEAIERSETQPRHKPPSL